MASLDEAVSVMQNMVQAVNALAQAYRDNEGQASAENIAAATLLKKGKGRIARVSVNTAGTTVGNVNDAPSATLATSVNLMTTIPNTIGVYAILMPFETGLVVTPGAGQVLTVSYS